MTYQASAPFDLPKHRLFCVLARACRLCLRLEEVDRLIPLVELQGVPQGPDYLIGLMNLQGEAVPVIDLGMRLGLGPAEPYSLETSILLVSVAGVKAGLIVDDVLGVTSVAREDIRGDALFRDGAPPVLGTVTQACGVALLMDTARIISLDLSGVEAPLELGEALRNLCREGAS